MANIFLSYRREDGTDFCDILMGFLARQYGLNHIFRDVVTITVGQDFVSALTRALNECRVILVIISPHWLSLQDSTGKRRLDDPNDFVRFEIVTALRHKKLVIPILMPGARMPRRMELPPELAALASLPGYPLRADEMMEQDLMPVITLIRRFTHNKPASYNVLIGALVGLIALLIPSVAFSFAEDQTKITSFIAPIAIYLTFVEPILFLFIIQRAWRTRSWGWIGAVIVVAAIQYFLLIFEIKSPQTNATYGLFFFGTYLVSQLLFFLFGVQGPMRPPKASDYTYQHMRR